MAHGPDQISFYPHFFTGGRRGDVQTAKPDMETGNRRARRNAMRAGLVAVGAVAFAYLSFQVGFKPYIERVQEAMDRPHQKRGGEADPPSSPPDASSGE